MADCDICTRPVHDTAYVCTPDTERLAQLLRDAPALLADLRDAVERQTRRARTTITGTSEAALPLDVHAGAVHDQAVAALTTWVRIIAEEHAPLPAPGPAGRRVYEGPACQARADHGRCHHTVCTPAPAAPPGDPIALAVQHLVANLEWLRHQPYAADAWRELTTALRRAYAATDTRPERHYLGRCYLPQSDGTECTTEIHAIVGATHTTCRGCGEVWDIAARREWLLTECRAQLATVVETARLLTTLLGDTITTDTVKSWVRRRQLPPRGTDRAGTTLHRLGDAIDLATRALAIRAKREAAAPARHRRRNTTQAA